VTSLGRNAFDGCTSLASVELVSGLLSIGHFAFNGCTSLASVALPSSLLSIGDVAFLNCTSLASVAIPASVTSLGNHPFSGCTALTRATFLGDVPTTLLNPFENVGPGFVLHYRPGAAGWTTPTWQASWDGGSATYATSPLSLAAIPASQLPLDILYGSAAIIEVNSTSPALRVTQLGEGHALVVESDTHPDATPLFVDKDGNLNLFGQDTVARLSSPTGSHNRVGLEFQRDSGTTRLWTLVQDPLAAHDTNLALRRLGDPAEPLVFNFRQSGHHDANDNWVFTGNVTVEGTLTASQLPPFGSSLPTLSEFPPSAPVAGQRWIDSTTLDAFEYLGGAWAQTT
jgi:hypothetical protein